MLKIDEKLKEGLDRYVEDGILPGSFLQGVLRNNFCDAVLHADATNSINLKQIALYVYWEIPHPCWGSRKKVEEWVEAKKIARIEKRAKEAQREEAKKK